MLEVVQGMHAFMRIPLGSGVLQLCHPLQEGWEMLRGPCACPPLVRLFPQSRSLGGTASAHPALWRADSICCAHAIRAHKLQGPAAGGVAVVGQYQLAAAPVPRCCARDLPRRKLTQKSRGVASMQNRRGGEIGALSLFRGVTRREGEGG